MRKEAIPSVNNTRHPWPAYLYDDYSAAAIRLTTVMMNGKQHLLYACVELYPHEIPLPPNRNPLLKKQIGRCGTLASTITVMSVRDAIDWYESALRGQLKAPGIDQVVSIAVGELAAEPILGRLLVAEESLPFNTRWYCGPRMHHLVPMQDPDSSLNWLTPDFGEPARIKAREWIVDILGFDLLAYDEYLFSLVLLAPNPVARSIHWHIEQSLSNGGERIRVNVVPRHGASIKDLQVSFREERAEGTALIYRCELDSSGSGYIDLPQLCFRSGLEIVCPSRGVLGVLNGHRFWRDVHVESRSLNPKVEISVPPRRKTDKPSTTSISHWEPGHQQVKKASIPSALLRTIELKERRATRTGEALPEAMMLGGHSDERIFYRDRNKAVQTIHSLVAHAKAMVVFIDPYFDDIDLRQFALAAQFANVEINILIGKEPLSKYVDPDAFDFTLIGDRFVEDIGVLEEKLKHARVPVPKVKLMGENTRTYHDRFLLIDEQVWHVGNSFNKLGGNEVSMATLLRYPDEIHNWIMEDIGNAALFVDCWPIIKERKGSKSKSNKNLGFHLRQFWRYLRSTTLSRSKRSEGSRGETR